MDKKEIDSMIGNLISAQLNAGGTYPNKIVISKELKRKINDPIKPYPTLMVYDDIPIEVDDSIPGERIYLL